MIHAPFNFVPLSNDVYYPTWGNQISLDIPFEKNYTGYLEFNITAKSPIFVRNGNSQKQNEAVRELCKLVSSRLNNEIAKTLHINGPLNKNHEILILDEMQKNKRKWDQKFTELLHEEATKAHNDLSNLLFSNIQNRYFLPSTSIKGCVRNALEILSFGKIKDRLSDDRYGFREMTGLYLNGMRVENIHCGYLVVRDGKITISDHGIPYRISHEALDSKITDLNFVQEYGMSYKRDREQKKSPKHKIDKLNIHRPLPTRFSEAGDSFSRKLVVIDENGLIEGNIVVTGQPGQRNFNNGKFYEFVFPKCSVTIYNDLEKGLLYQDFLFINKNDESGSWTTWENQLLRGEEVPVFFTVENDVVRDMGLSYMYKRPFKYRISDCIKQPDSNKPDLAECIFGRIKDDAFKGRVQFSNAFANEIKGEQLVERLILSSPKASYYPMYIEQSSSYLKSYQDKTAVISGWKKYPIRRDVSSKNMNNAKLDSFMIPLGKETTFTCRMNFFNLKGAELGALLSVLTFHGSADDYYLSIGQGKPYGYGKIKITPTQLCINNELVAREKIREKSIIFMKTFESNLVRTLYTSNNKFLNWHNSDIVKEFYTMSYDVLEASNSLLQYMDLNDFPYCKKNREYLQRFSKICNSSKTPESLLPSK